MSRLEDYLRLSRDHPALFLNPPQGGFSILLDEQSIHQAEAEAAQHLAAAGLPRAWAKVGIVYHDQYLLILRDAVRFPDGRQGTYIRQVVPADAAPGVAILPHYHDQILLIRHFRHATRAWHLEIPRGFGVKDASSREQATRELAEEIGGSVSHLIPLGVMYPDTGISAVQVDLFYAQVVAYGDVETHEAIVQLAPVSLSEFERLIRENEVTDPFAIVAYTRAKLQGLLS